MKLTFSCEAVFQYYNGIYYGSSASFGMMLWNRYLEEFDSIEVIARVEEADGPTPYPIDAEKVKICPLPRYKGIYGALDASRYLKKELGKFINADNAYILRVPGQIGSTFSKVLQSRGIKYGVEVVGDPWDVMGSIGGAMSFLLKRIGMHQLKEAVSNCSVALYVTKSKLQSRYPVKTHIRSYAVSDVIIPKDFFAGKPHRMPHSATIPNLIAIGSLEQLYKAPDIAISALSILQKMNIKVNMKWLGGGRHINDMRKLAKKKGVDDMIEFLGDVNRDMVESCLDKADLFIHISRTEGLPRAIVEAMAKGLPVIGTNVGGIPELISQRCIVEPDDAQETADKIKAILSDSSFYETEAKNNLSNAWFYEDVLLSSQRKQFFRDIKRLAAE